VIGLVWAQSSDGVIGRDGALPWHLPEDMARFRTVTGGATVVMGRRTWESLPERFRPLPGRRNVVLTRRAGWEAPGAVVAASVPEALAAAGEGDAWVIGGSEVYRAALPLADVLEVTEVDLVVDDGDALAPPVGEEWRVSAVEPSHGWLTSTTGLRYRFVTHRRR
jgi:dihydrofolate reductase